MSGFQWNDERSEAARLLAEGRTKAEVSGMVGVDERTIYRWQTDTEFSSEVDRLTFMVDIASRAERLRMAMRVARQNMREDGTITTGKHLLDWLKFAQSETSGIALDLPAKSDLASMSQEQRKARIHELMIKSGYCIAASNEISVNVSSRSDDELEPLTRQLP